MREGEEWARESRGDRPRPSTARTPGSEAPAHRTSCGVSGRSLRPSPGTRRKAAGLSGALGRSGAWQAPACGLGMRAEEGAPVPGALAPASRLQSSVPSLGSGGLRTDADSWKVVRSVQNKQRKMAAA